MAEAAPHICSKALDPAQALPEAGKYLPLSLRSIVGLVWFMMVYDSLVSNFNKKNKDDLYHSLIY